MQKRKSNGCNIRPVLRELDDTVKDHAILSHRLVVGGDVGCTEMVELARLESRNEIQRVGYQKVVKTCQKTTNDGLG